MSLLMAVCLDPQHFCLVMEHFQLGSLNHLLYKTETEMNLPERVHLLLDVAEGMTYLHGHSIVHGCLNPFSVFVYEKFRAKIGNLAFSQEDSEQKHENACSVHENWMAPEQLLHEPPNMAGDAYRLVFAALRTINLRISGQGLVSRKLRKLFGPLKPFFVHLNVKTEKCIRLKLLV